MKIALSQFPVSGEIDENYKRINRDLDSAIEQKARVIVFPECALTGYPPIELNDINLVNTSKIELYKNEIHNKAKCNDLEFRVRMKTGP